MKPELYQFQLARIVSHERRRLRLSRAQLARKSRRLALTKDINSVAFDSENSPEMIRRYYLDLVTPEAARRWFSL